LSEIQTKTIREALPHTDELPPVSLGFLVFFCVIECFAGEEECREPLSGVTCNRKPGMLSFERRHQ
jgi:hypothetical protein